MKIKFIIFVLFIIAIYTLTACKSNNNVDNTSYNDKITAAQAKEMIDENSEIIILDVRTESEYNAGHIEGAILIPDYDIANKAESILTDKSAIILVYCRSGRRSALSAKALNKLGYTNVYDFGGISDWDYELVYE